LRHILINGLYFYLERYLGGKVNTSEPMQIISDPIGREKIYFEATPSEVLPKEMALFIERYNKSAACNLPDPACWYRAYLFLKAFILLKTGMDV
jgi:hypothetical protein